MKQASRPFLQCPKCKALAVVCITNVNDGVTYCRCGNCGYKYQEKGKK